ncbi:peptidylprolyl isomerase [uncultured Thermanaerothrix sp.]|uniref:peptidylprolyl isomerase n=1 Tax=uncultured Thermanaerothrix sp. TaxID=1195149 RepID=UPI00260E0467|nr:peptidylprolyl isomerase [uncultured Thermanaerothrix sp.]
MRKLLWLILFSVVISACAPATPTSTPTPTSVPTEAASPTDCRVVDLFPSPKNPTDLKLPPITAQDYSRGADRARVTILEYSDFQCPYCSLAAGFLKNFEAQHPKEVRVVFRHFPLNIHDKAQLAAQVAEAAALQGKFWELHDFLFEQQQAWAAQTPTEFETWIVQQAASLGLDTQRLAKDMKSTAVVDKVKKATQEALNIGLSGTPSLFIFLDDQLVFTPTDRVPYDAQTLNLILELHKLRDRQYKQCPPTVINPTKQYTATLKTEKGDIVIRLYADKAPFTVNNFVFLARNGWYNGVTFHRVIPDFVAQTGDPTGTGLGGPGYQFRDEMDANLKYDRPGVVGMANAGPNTNGSQFFITYQALPNLDGNYPIFGEVIAGMDVLKALTPRDPDQSQGDLPPGDKILSITIEEK